VRDYAGTADTYISAYAPAGNYAAQANLMIKNDGIYLGLLRFDLSSLPSDALVQQATLRLFAYNRDKVTSMDVQVYPLLRAWSDAQVNWNRASASDTWAVPGAGAVGSDRGAEPCATQTVSTLNTWYEFDVTSLVAAWCANPVTNAGVLLRGQGQISVVYHMASANHTPASLRPRLVIGYVAP